MHMRLYNNKYLEVFPLQTSVSALEEPVGFLIWFDEFNALTDWVIALLCF